MKKKKIRKVLFHHSCFKYKKCKKSTKITFKKHKNIANFLSFEDRITFSMQADTKEELADNYVIKDNRKILKTAAIYGANTSGKTNIMKVVGTVVNILKDYNNYNIDTTYVFCFKK